jgi:DNA mismatch repair protein MutL
MEVVLVQIKDDDTFLKKNALENIAELLAKKTSMSYAKPLAAEEMQYLIDRLFSCQMPNFTNSGKKIIEIINFEDLEKKFK